MNSGVLMSDTANKTACIGRPKGSRNKNKLALQEKCLELGIDTFEIMALFAAGDWKALGYEGPTINKLGNGNVIIEELTISPDLRFKAAKEVTAYLHAKKRDQHEADKARRNRAVFAIGHIEDDTNIIKDNNGQSE